MGPFMSEDVSKQPKQWPVILTQLFVAAILAAFFVLSFYSRPAIDEFAYVDSAHDRGFWENQVRWWQDWSGRYSATGSIDLFFTTFDLIQHHFFVGLLTLGLFLLSTWLVLRASVGKWFNRIECFWAAATTMVIYLVAMPTTAEAFYWANGAWTYTSGLIAAMLLVAMLLKWGPTAKGFAAVALHIGVLLLAFVLAGFNELVMLGMSGLLLIAAVVLKRQGDRAWQFWLTAMVGCWIGTGLVIAAPGHAIRQEIFVGWGNDVEDPVKTMERSIAGAIFMLSRAWHLALFVALILIQDYVPRLRGWRFLTVKPLSNIWFVIAGYLLLFIGLFGPSWWGIGAPPPPRAVNVIYFVMILGAFHVALLIGLSIQDEARTTPLLSPKIRGCLLMIFIVGLLGAKNTEYALYWDVWINAPAYSAQMDQRFEMLDEMRQRSVKHAVVPPIPQDLQPKLLFVDDITPNPNSWRNAGIRDYYGFETVRLGNPDHSQ